MILIQRYTVKIKRKSNHKKDRTNFELSICQMCISSSKPILGICGGEQLLNVACGGTLIQDIPNHIPYSLKHEQVNPRNQTSHSVNIKSKTKIKK